MADGTSTVEVARFPQGKYVDALRWLPPVAAFDRLVTTALYDADSGASSVQVHTLTPADAHFHCPLRLELQTTWTSPARISKLKVASFSQKAIIAAASSGCLCFLVADPLQVSLEAEGRLGLGASSSYISGMDLQPNSTDCECVCVGEDGKINLVRLAEGQMHHKCVTDNRGLISYTAARWASPTEFVTAGLGFSLQWWDHRKPGAPVSQSPNKWIGGSSTGVIHSIDVHPSRKHICVVGGSSGSVFAWDLRRQQEPIPLAGIGSSSRQISGFLSESEVWEVKYDHYTQSAGLDTTSSKILPVMMCSEDGILAVLESDYWWRCYGARTPHLQKLAIRILSQTCSSSGCERNWSVFEKIHAKKRNRLEFTRLNDLVYVHYNIRLRVRQIESPVDPDAISLDNIDVLSPWRVESEEPILEESPSWLEPVADDPLEQGQQEEDSEPEEQQDLEEEQEEEDTAGASASTPSAIDIGEHSSMPSTHYLTLGAEAGPGPSTTRGRPGKQPIIFSRKRGRGQ